MTTTKKFLVSAGPRSTSGTLSFFPSLFKLSSSLAS
ncbi:hypothetical protein T03_10474 [Trichinella britovi]|uniref:Uncharacterized protein n=1 Tax=Trichinella britovi TaxID=45882 RepID=A0A0V0Z2J3_TRIBR|nr:hypothetical protein T03_10474 [Trichinella britovi]